MRGLVFRVLHSQSQNSGFNSQMMTALCPWSKHFILHSSSLQSCQWVNHVERLRPVREECCDLSYRHRVTEPTNPRARWSFERGVMMMMMFEWMIYRKWSGKLFTRCYNRHPTRCHNIYDQLTRAILSYKDRISFLPDVPIQYRDAPDAYFDNMNYNSNVMPYASLIFSLEFGTCLWYSNISICFPNMPRGFLFYCVIKRFE